MEHTDLKSMTQQNLPEDQQIVRLFFQRSEKAITYTRQKYGSLCISVARRILSDPRDAEECVNDTYLHAWNAIPPEKPDSLKAFLARITRKLALDRYDYNTADQRNTALTEAFEQLEPWLTVKTGESEAELDSAEINRVLNSFLRKQTLEARTLFLRRYWYGESIRELAKACHMSESMVKSSLFRTRNKLRKELEKEGISQ